MSSGQLTSSSINLVAFFMQVFVTFASAVTLLYCLKLKKRKQHEKTPKRAARDKYAENTFTEKSEEFFAHLQSKDSPSRSGKRKKRSTPDKKLSTDPTQDLTMDLQTCPSRELTRTKTRTTEATTTEIQSTATKSVTISAYHPPPAPPRDIEKDRKRAKNALQIFCQREKKKNSEDDEEDDPTTNTQPPEEEIRISAEHVKKSSESNQKS